MKLPIKYKTHALIVDILIQPKRATQLANHKTIYVFSLGKGNLNVYLFRLVIFLNTKEVLK
jgi:hypothetical protein